MHRKISMFFLFCLQISVAFTSEDSLLYWSTAEYKAQVTSAGTCLMLENPIDPDVKAVLGTGDYVGQFKAWNRICKLAKKGSVGEISKKEFEEERLKVYQNFDLPIPTIIHYFARYKTLKKWAAHPLGFPDYGCFSRDVVNGPILQMTDELRNLAIYRTTNKTPLYRELPAKVSRPKTELDIQVLLNNYSLKAGPLLYLLKVWFGNNKGGFCSILNHHLKTTSTVNPLVKEKLECDLVVVGSYSHGTALAQADLDTVIIFNEGKANGAEFSWSKDNPDKIEKVKINNKVLTQRELLTLWECFFKALESHQITHHSYYDPYNLEQFKPHNYQRARATQKLLNTHVDIIPALRAIDGSFLFFTLLMDKNKKIELTYSNAAMAKRILDPYMKWEFFPETIKLLKFLFEQEWNPYHPKVFGAMSETLAVDIAKTKTQEEWERTSLLVLLGACLDKLHFYVETGLPIRFLNSPSSDTLPARENEKLKSELIETIKKFKSYSIDEIFSKLEFALFGLNNRYSKTIH